MSQTQMPTLLVIANRHFTDGIRKQFESFVRKNANLSPIELRYETGLTTGMQIKRGKSTFVANPAMRDEFFVRLMRVQLRYRAKAFIILDEVALEYITGKHRSLDLTRGGVYFVDTLSGEKLPAIVCDSLRLKGKNGKPGGSKLAVVNHAKMLLTNDISKAERWLHGTQIQEPQFNFDVIDTMEKYREIFVPAMRAATAIAMDLETSGNGKSALITCSGYALLMPDGTAKSMVIPFLNPFKPNGHQWDETQFADLLASLREMHMIEAPKILQNGSYDTHYYTRYRMPLRNYVFDTAVAFHSIWSEIPKRIDFICSLFVDHYRYWKDEGKADAKDDSKADALPKTETGWGKYLRYCGLDCHYTLLAGIATSRIINQIDWAGANYRKSMRHVLGPAAAMSLRGVRVNRDIQDQFTRENEAAFDKHRNALRTMVDDAEFNPNSPAQVAELLYDVLGAEPLPRRGKTKARSTDEKDLKIIATQSPFIDKIVRELWATKKPANNRTKYGKSYYNPKTRRMHGLTLFNGRWMYKMNTTGTETGRYASKASDFWVGTQIQNPPSAVRPMVEADPGYVLFDLDYDKADFWHTAFASGEPEMMKVALDPNVDVHCYHAAKFFAKEYDAIYEGYKNKESWVVDSLEGVRQNSKRIVYGANYLMAGATLFIQMGKEAVDATAISLDRNTATWQIKDYTKFCQELLDFYFDVMYPDLQPWLEETIRTATTNSNIVVCCGGRTRLFFADLWKDKAGQRELAAFYGQGGTASTVNDAIDEIYYSGLDSQDLMLFFQVHDSLIGQVREDKLHLLKDVKRIMERPNTFNGRTFTIPVSGDVGRGWGRRMCSWHPDITLAEIDAADAEWHEKHFESAETAIANWAG